MTRPLQPPTTTPGAAAWQRLARRRVSRRTILAATGRAGIGAASLALVGCSGNDDEPEPPNEQSVPTTAPPAASQQTVRPPQPAPTQRGGELRFHTSLADLDFFDIHRSRFVTTQRFSALQQNKLIRYADIDRGELEGDLSALPEIPDETTYVFLLRPDVLWWSGAPTDGRPFTTQDVLANVERQIAGVDASGASEPLLLRQALYAQTASLEAIDDTTLVARTDAPNAAYLPTVHAGPWSFFQAPEIWALFGDRLRDEPLDRNYYSGTGPFRISALSPENRISFRPNPTYFRSGAPYLDQITYLHNTTAAQQEAAYRDGAIDAWSPGDPAAVDAVLLDFPDHRVDERPLPFAVELAFSYRSASANPLRDRRIAAAVHQALDRNAIRRRVYGDHAVLSGAAPWYTRGWALPNDELTQLPGYRPTFPNDDESAARGLLDAAAFSGPLTLHLSDIFAATYPGIGDDIQGSLQRRLGIELRIVISPLTRILDGLSDGSVAATIGWGEAITDPDPTAHLLSTVHSDGPRNRGGFNDPAVDAAIESMRATMDTAARQRIFLESVQPALLSAPSWALNITHGLERTVHPPEIHLPRFGFGWDGHRLELAWRGLAADDPASGSD